MKIKLTKEQTHQCIEAYMYKYKDQIDEALIDMNGDWLRNLKTEYGLKFTSIDNVDKMTIEYDDNKFHQLLTMIQLHKERKSFSAMDKLIPLTDQEWHYCYPYMLDILTIIRQFSKPIKPLK